ncbi:hypothetical protein [uncultured Tenacibaculum sp.]|uniref:hypothetical protein n=1 Tax=uncultured Tenacibaculum sp. TaxID=174713 RepID=UPI002635740E|nr:hypothetical protein [uncultured Tenacibaculum sp.]
MNKIKIFIIVFIFGFVGCEKMNSDRTEKRIAERIAKHVIEKDSLKNYTYSGDVFLHIKSERLNDENYKTLISLNGVKSKSIEFRNDRIIIDGFEIIIYYDKSKSEYNLPEPFFVPDSKGWSFLAELIEDNIILSKLELEISVDKKEIEELDEIDF